MIGYVNNGYDNQVTLLTREKLNEVLDSNYQHQLIDRIRQEPSAEKRGEWKRKLRAMMPMGCLDEKEYAKYLETYQLVLNRVPPVQQAAWQQKVRKMSPRKVEFTQPSGLFMIDCDHCAGGPQTVYRQFLQAMMKHRISLQGFLAWASVTASGDGLRLILKGRKGSNIVDDQLWLAQLANLQIDAACKDITRLSFLTVAEDTLYRDDALLFGPSQEIIYTNPYLGCWDKRKRPAPVQSLTDSNHDNLAPSPASATPLAENTPATPLAENAPATGYAAGNAHTEPHPAAAEPTAANPAVPAAATPATATDVVGKRTEADALGKRTEADALGEKTKTDALEERTEADALEERTEADALEERTEAGSGGFPTDYHGFSFNEILQTYWNLHNYGHEPTRGDRDTLTFQLACDLRHLCDNNFDWLNAVIPCYDGFSENAKQQKIRNALNTTNSSNLMPRRMQMVLEYLNSRRSPALPAAAASAAEEEEESADRMPPEMPAKLPPLIALLVSNTPEVYRPAVAHAVFPSLAVHLHRAKFRYIDNVLHEATLSNILMAGTGAGKDCISEPINRIMEDIRRQDAINLGREKAWKNEMISKSSSKDKRLRPEGLVIQEIDADMTNPAFVMRTAEADEHFLYAKMGELDQFDALKGSAGQQFQIMCLAFDPGNRYGQTRVGAQSVTEKVTIRFNFNACTTILKGKRYFQRVLTDGPVSRINFCTIPEREIGADMPVYGVYDEQFDKRLRPFIENLTRTHGIIDCPEAFKLAQTLREECADEARLTQNRVYENLSFRALVIAYLKACVLYVSNGCRWEETFADFVRWSLRYDLWCKMEFFGAAIEQASQDTTSGAGGYKQVNLLDLLPEVFTVDDATALRRRRGMDVRGVRNMISQWKSRKYVCQIDEKQYKKIK